MKRIQLRLSRADHPYYPDIPLFLIIIPFIAAINYYLTYSNIRLNWFLVLTFSIDTIQGYIAVLVVRQTILYLDTVYPFRKNIFRRIILQVPVTTVLGLFVISFLTEFVSLIARGKLVPLSFYTYDLFIIGIWFLVVNAIYIILHFYQKWKTWEDKLGQLSKDSGIFTRVGDRDLRIEYDMIFGFKVEGNYVVCIDSNNQRYILDQSLNEIEKVLPLFQFFRLNRQFILNRSQIKGFKRSENRKIITLIAESSTMPSEIMVSRTKAPAFKKWFRRDEETFQPAN